MIAFALSFCSSVLIAATGFAAAPASAQTPYDGLWNVTVVTKTGSCEPSSQLHTYRRGRKGFGARRRRFRQRRT